MNPQMTQGVERLDQALVARGLVPSRARAQAAIAAGLVRLNGEVARKAHHGVRPHDSLSLAESEAARWVSRAALKLVHALDHFALDVRGARALDLGASTGGFTQVLLERGAAHVVAVDVGHGQMAPVLAQDARVTLIEKCNVRDLTAAHLPWAPDLITADLSFISLRKALPAPLALARPGARLVALLKPQFEVGRAGIGKGGLVKDATLVDRVLAEMPAWLQATCGARVAGPVASPIAGGDGNREFLLLAELP